MRIPGLAVFLLILSAAGAIAAPAPVGNVRSTIPFDTDWRFFRSAVAGPERLDFDDSAWQSVTVPHDWAIEGPFDQNNRARGAGAWLPSGVAWYRKHFALRPEDTGRRVFIEFDGVMSHSDVWINGVHLGNRPYGYASFRYELTGCVVFSGEPANVLVVSADTSAQPASRWYAGAGIYRHVRLVITDPVHIDQYGTFVSTPSISAEKADVLVNSTIVNESATDREVTLQVNVLAPDGQSVQAAELTQTISAGQPGVFNIRLAVDHPQLWDLDHPSLYHLASTVRIGNKAVDDETVSFGIRDASFSAETGFSLNGKNFKIKGVCLHGDAGGLGVAVPTAAWERRLAQLKLIGCNAIRTAHNPPAPEFLDLCDRMGFLVMDEMFDCWTVAKNPFDYHLDFNDWFQTDAADAVRRDRNHPSIILYSAGNEIHDTPKPGIARPILVALMRVFHENDPTRPVTQALFRPNVSHDYNNGFADLLDVVGQNYRENEIIAAHVQKPTRKIIGTENGRDLKAWSFVRDNAFHSGQFLWTGDDYLGESRRWPAIGAGAGLIDLTGAPKPGAYQRQSWWSDKPMVYIAREEVSERRALATNEVLPGDLPQGFQAGQPRRAMYSNWTPANTQPHDENILVFTTAEQVELFLNGKSLGSQNRPADQDDLKWKVPFEAGSLKAIAKTKDEVVATYELRTASKPDRIILTVERSTLSPSWEDVAYITATVVDGDGVTQPLAKDLITFNLNGPGTITAVENGDLSSHESFRGNQRHAFNGRCVAIIRAAAPSGKLEITATAPGLRQGTVAIGIVP